MSERRVAYATSPFARVTWQDGRLRAGGACFVIQEFGAADLEPAVGGDPCFVLYKNRHTLARYEQFFNSTPGYRPARIFEIGIWKAGSAVFFTEIFDVEKLIAIDLRRHSDLAHSTLGHLNAWLGRNDRERQVKLYFGVDQRDAPRLQEIVRREFSGSLDLVLDDGSHLYDPTKRSFETLFPYVGPGGWYVIEDWSWSLAPPFQSAAHPWALEKPMASLVGEILTLAGARPDVISEIRVTGQLVFIQRGLCQLDDTFSIERSITRPPYGPLGIRARRAWWAAARLGSKLAGAREEARQRGRDFWTRWQANRGKDPRRPKGK